MIKLDITQWNLNLNRVQIVSTISAYFMYLWPTLFFIFNNNSISLILLPVVTIHVWFCILGGSRSKDCINILITKHKKSVLVIFVCFFGLIVCIMICLVQPSSVTVESVEPRAACNRESEWWWVFFYFLPRSFKALCNLTSSQKNVCDFASLQVLPE